jgi:hypothetical protein
MKIKKEAKRINKAKKRFLKWLDSEEIENINIYTNYEDPDFDYYIGINAFSERGGANSVYYNVYFSLYKGKESIDYRDKSHHYSDLSIFEFLQLITIFDS